MQREKRVYLAVDAIVERGGEVLLIERRNPPPGWALPPVGRASVPALAGPARGQGRPRHYGRALLRGMYHELNPD